MCGPSGQCIDQIAMLPAFTRICASGPDLRTKMSGFVEGVVVHADPTVLPHAVCQLMKDETIEKEAVAMAGADVPKLPFDLCERPSHRSAATHP